MLKTLDLGCGQNPANPYNADEVYGVDISIKSSKFLKNQDLCINKIPFKESYFDFVTAIDFLEHIPRVLYQGRKRKQPFIELMNEIWRVLKPGGLLLAFTPTYPRDEAFVDPTHVNFISEKTVNYFCGGEYLDLMKSYGFNGEFRKIRSEWSNVATYHLIWELEAKK